jgi:hypothetical protein
VYQREKLEVKLCYTHADDQYFLISSRLSIIFACPEKLVPIEFEVVGTSDEAYEAQLVVLGSKKLTFTCESFCISSNLWQTLLAMKVRVS